MYSNVRMLKISLVCRWSFPQSTGGVAMHNHYLLNALEKKFKRNLISAESEINSGFNKNNGVGYSGIPITGYGAISQFLKFLIPCGSKFLIQRGSKIKNFDPTYTGSGLYR